MTDHNLAYVRRSTGGCYWTIYCTCLNVDQPGRDTDPIYATGWLGAIPAHPAGGACPGGYNHGPDREVWEVRDVDATHVEFKPSINTQIAGIPPAHWHFHTGNPTGPIEVRPP